MDSTFRECRNLKAVNLTNFNARNVEYLGGLFMDCTSLISVDLSTFKTSNKLKDTRNMFYKCTSLKYINLSNFNTENVDIMAYMFHY